MHLTDEKLLALLGVHRTRLDRIIERLPHHYRVVSIMLGEKERLLHIPSRNLKPIQRRLARLIPELSPPHANAFCHTGRGPLRAIRRHAGHPYLLRLDLQDFFPSISHSNIAHAVSRLPISGPMKQKLTSIVCFRNHLPQGAPSSTALSNLVMTHLDNRVSNLCSKWGLTYTRYVDDIAVSGGRRVQKAEAIIRRIIDEEGWTLNEAKSERLGPGEKRKYLGVVLNTEPSVEREYIRALRFAIRRIGEFGYPVSISVQQRLKGRVLYVKAVREKQAIPLELLYARYIEPLGTLQGPERRRVRRGTMEITEMDVENW